MRWLLLTFLLLPLSAAMPGCGSDDDEPKGSSSGKVCTARKTIFCRCPKTGEGGWQTCLADGSGFDDCVPCDGSNLDPVGGGGGSTPVNPNVESECPNGKTELGEECDDGNLDDDDGCLSNCRKAKCGDGVVRTGVEECDDANDNDSDGCSNACVKKAVASETCPGEALTLTGDSAGKVLSGQFEAYQPNIEGSCGGTGSDAVFSFVAPSKGTIDASLTVDKGSPVNPVLYLRADGCDDASKQIVCVNEGGPGATEATGFLDVEKGKTYYIFADSEGNEAGKFNLHVRFRPDEACEGQGGPCEAVDAKGRCAQGTLSCSAQNELVCQPSAPAASETCGDGVDDDCNGVPDNGCPCAHGVCEPGVAVAADCSGSPDSACIAKICAQDDYCCTVEWDGQCVEQVLPVCGIGKCLKGTCAHPICQAGAKLAQGCDGAAKCVEAICKTDGFCCGQEWDNNCVGKIADICKINCGTQAP